MVQHSSASRVEKALQWLHPCQALNVETKGYLTREKEWDCPFKAAAAAFFFFFFKDRWITKSYRSLSPSTDIQVSKVRPKDDLITP